MTTGNFSRVALVTGGASGIGRASASRLARDGLHVVIADTRPAQDVVTEIKAAGGSAEAVICDLGVPGAAGQMAQAVIGKLGRCDVLLNNAAHIERGTLAELDLPAWRRVFAVNVDAAFVLCSVVVPVMAEHGSGRIINVISNTVWQPPPVALLAYVTSKAAMLGFTRALAREAGPSGITVNAVAPGLTRTPSAVRHLPAEFFLAVREQQALNRSIEPDDLAGAVSFLASADAALVTGQVICVDGGIAMV
jgi:NAD(P)-dependent dehydrogenase (short-subunit alcohol dehydrogenase family)